MHSVSDSPQGGSSENSQLLQGLRNPVLRTYLFPNDSKNWRRYFLLLSAWLGLLMITLGPLSGQLLIPRILKQEAAWHQLISPEMDCHKPTNSPQLCSHSLKIAYNLFNLTNADGFLSGESPPILRAVGPFVFLAVVSNEDVSYSRDRELVHKSVSLRLFYSQEDSCRECGTALDSDLQLLDKEALSGSGRSSGLLIRRKVKDILKGMAMGAYKLNYTLVGSDGRILDVHSNASSGRQLSVRTGYRDWNETSCVVDLDSANRHAMLGRDSGQVFGINSNFEHLVMFDRWIAKTMYLKRSESVPTVRGIETNELKLDTNQACSGVSCIKNSWNATSQFGVPTVITLPFFEGMNPEHKPNWFSKPARQSHGNQEWKFHVDREYGFTIDSQSAFQVSHFVAKGTNNLPVWVPYESSGILIPTHWIQVRYNISEVDLLFIKSLYSKSRLGYYIGTIMLTVIGSCLLANSFYQLTFSKAAKMRSKTMKILLRSRARDPMLNPAQYTALRHFMVSQMKKPRRTRGTDEVDSKQDTKTKKGRSSQSSLRATGK